MLALSYPRPARKALAPLEIALANEAEYWDAVGRAADALKEDAQDLLRAARKAHALAPDNFAHQLNYAGALLANRQAPEQALQLTLAVINHRPESSFARLYHGAALAMNRRFEEAEAALNSVRTEGLDGPERALFHLAHLEARFGQRQPAEAARSLGQIQDDLLFAPQREVVKTIRGCLEPLSE
jgi:predicted Zn-dependent protease